MPKTKPNIKHKKNTISGDMTLGEVAKKYPKVADVLQEEYGMHCASCPMAAMETLDEGLEVHGMSQNKRQALIRKLNELI